MALKYVRAGKIATIRPKAIPVELNWDSLQKAYGRSVCENLRWSAELAVGQYFADCNTEILDANCFARLQTTLNAVATAWDRLHPEARKWLEMYMQGPSLPVLLGAEGQLKSLANAIGQVRTQTKDRYRGTPAWRLLAMSIINRFDDYGLPTASNKEGTSPFLAFFVELCEQAGVELPTDIEGALKKTRQRGRRLRNYDIRALPDGQRKRFEP